VSWELLAACALVFGVGALRMAEREIPGTWPAIPLDARFGRQATIEGRVARFPDIRGERVHLVLDRVRAIDMAQQPEPGDRVLLRIRRPETLPRYGDVVRIRALIREPTGYRKDRNPRVGTRSVAAAGRRTVPCAGPRVSR
jgi:hypothetical protein